MTISRRVDIFVYTNTPLEKDSEMQNGNYTMDLGNNESLTRGLFIELDGTFLAMTFTQSKSFKTRKGAERWLERRGLDPRGNRI